MTFKLSCAILAVAAVLISGCASKNPKEVSVLNKGAYSGLPEKNGYDLPLPWENYSYEGEEEIFIDDALLPPPEMTIYSSFAAETAEDGESEYYEEFKEFNVPIAMTSRVFAYIKYFTERVPKTTQAWLDRSNKYMYIVKDIFIKESLPTDLVVLGFTESGFNTKAVSRAGAAGMWQFIPSTGKLYGMENDFWLDERRDFEQATYAAAKYLKSLHGSFKDWYLALAAYNAGPGKISRATKKHETKDFFKISKNRHTLKLETRDYVPKFLALLIIYKNYLKFGFTSPSEMPLLYAEVKVPGPTNLYWLAKNLNVETEALAELNPALKLPITPPGKEYKLRVPYGMGVKAAELIASSTPEERAMYKVHNAKKGEKMEAIAKKYSVRASDIKELNGLKYDTVFAGRPLFIPVAGLSDEVVNAQFSALLAKLSPKYYRVKSGDTFTAIASRHNMRLSDLRKLNPNIRASRIYPGQRIVVSEGGSFVKKGAPAKKSSATSAAGLVKKGKYRVRSGDSLWSIAKKFGTTVDSIMAANNLRSDAIYPGKILSILR